MTKPLKLTKRAKPAPTPNHSAKTAKGSHDERFTTLDPKTAARLIAAGVFAQVNQLGPSFFHPLEAPYPIHNLLEHVIAELETHV